MAKKTINEAEDNRIESIQYQGKPLSQWEKDFNGEFTARQLFQLIRSGVDLGRIKLGLVDEAESSIDDKALFKDEEFFFNENDANEDQMNEVTDEEAALDESARNPEDVVTVGDFIELLRSRTDLDDKLVLRVAKKTAMLFDVNSKAGTTVIDIIPSIDAKRVNESENDAPLSVSDLIDELKDSTSSPNLDLALANVEGNPYYITKVVAKKNAVLLRCIPAGFNENVELDSNGTLDDFMTVGDLRDLGQKAYPNSRDAWLVDNIAGIVNGKVIDFKSIKYVRPEGYPSNGTFFLLDKSEASLAAYEKEKALMLSEKDNDMKRTNEGRKSWYGGGYGGTGRSYKSLGSRAPRGAEIGWYSVEQLDPKAAGKMPGWRCGPSNFPFEDLLYPERKYVKGAMVMRNKYLKAGSMSGEKYIAIPSYFDAINNNDQEAIDLLKALGIPLDLTFGMDPNDDYSMTYTIKS